MGTSAKTVLSSFKVNPHQLQVLVAVVEYKTKLSEPRQGLCSKWLSRLTPGTKVPIWIRKGTLRFPSDPKTPVIMVGPGTGCSPFRAFADEGLPLQQEEHLKLFCAFSRDQPHKIYVQHLI